LKASQTVQERERLKVQIPLALLIVIAVVYVGWLLSSGLLKPFVYRPLAMAWVPIPACEFQMGSERGRPNERPVHVVNLQSYDIGKYEVTNQQYAQCVKAGVCLPPRNERYESPEFLQYPVTDVSWYDARKFCTWIDPKGRLPTEAEWEKAARGTEGRIYPWGNELDCDHANYYDGTRSCVGHTKPVGSYEKGKSPYGVYDMIGNVHEWVADPYLAYPGNLESDPKYGETYRVLRGGSWGDNFKLIPTATLRMWNNPWDSNIGIFGFRCARGDVSQ
jgi:serine/threonine-protein kinase